MGFGAGDEPINMFFSALQFAGPEQHGNTPIRAMASVNEWSIAAAS